MEDIARASWTNRRGRKAEPDFHHIAGVDNGRGRGLLREQEREAKSWQ